MERIHIGRGPDFCMTCGLAVINYRVKITGVCNQVEFKSRVIVDRSLAMVLKKIVQNLPVAANDLILAEVKLFNQNPRFLLKCRKQEGHFEVQFYLPADLQIYQQANIVESFRKIFKRRL